MIRMSPGEAMVAWTGLSDIPGTRHVGTVFNLPPPRSPRLLNDNPAIPSLAVDVLLPNGVWSEYEAGIVHWPQKTLPKPYSVKVFHHDCQFQEQRIIRYRAP